MANINLYGYSERCRTGKASSGNKWLRVEIGDSQGLLGKGLTIWVDFDRDNNRYLFEIYNRETSVELFKTHLP